MKTLRDATPGAYPRLYHYYDKRGVVADVVNNKGQKLSLRAVKASFETRSEEVDERVAPSMSAVTAPNAESTCPTLNRPSLKLLETYTVSL